MIGQFLPKKKQSPSNTGKKDALRLALPIFEQGRFKVGGDEIEAQSHTSRAVNKLGR